MYALYIGLFATAVSYLYLKTLPFYVLQIEQGATADESLWWYTVHNGRFYIKTKQTGRTLRYALVFGLALSVGVLHKPWVPHASLWLNISIMGVWLGGLWLLARIDQLCFLLPDVLTQFLLWVGLMTAWLQSTQFLAHSVGAVVIVYVVGRIVNNVGAFWFKHSLFGHGDVKLVAAVAAWLGWESILPLLFLACVGCVVLEALRQQRWRPRGACAFGPYLVLATIGVWLNGTII